MSLLFKNQKQNSFFDPTLSSIYYSGIVSFPFKIPQKVKLFLLSPLSYFPFSLQLIPIRLFFSWSFVGLFFQRSTEAETSWSDTWWEKAVSMVFKIFFKRQYSTRLWNDHLRWLSTRRHESRMVSFMLRRSLEEAEKPCFSCLPAGTCLGAIWKSRLCYTVLQILIFIKVAGHFLLSVLNLILQKAICLGS